MSEADDAQAGLTDAEAKHRAELQERRERSDREHQEQNERELAEAAALTALPVNELIAFHHAGPQDMRGPMEMNGRLIAAIDKLTLELVSFRESSDAASKLLKRYTITLMVLTVLIVALTGALVGVAATQ